MLGVNVIQRNFKKMQESPETLADFTQHCVNKSNLFSESKKLAKHKKSERALSNNFFEAFLENNQNITLEEEALLNAYYNIKKVELANSN